MIRDTSIECYQEIVKNGLINGVRLQVYKEIVDHPKGITMAQCLDNLGLKRHHSGRFSELEERTVIKRSGRVKSEESGHSVTLYVATNNLPVEPKGSFTCEDCGVETSIMGICTCGTESLNGRLIKILIDTKGKGSISDLNGSVITEFKSIKELISKLK